MTTKLNFEDILNRRLRRSLAEWLADSNLTTYKEFKAWMEANSEEYSFSDTFVSRVQKTISENPYVALDSEPEEKPSKKTEAKHESESQPEEVSEVDTEETEEENSVSEAPEAKQSKGQKKKG